MKRFLLLLMCLCLVGCASLSNIRNTNRENLNKLSIGMTRRQVLGEMGQKTRTGYAYPFIVNLFSFGATTAYREPISNPFRSEIMHGQERTFEVVYYYTDIKSAYKFVGYGIEKPTVREEELTPLVFEENILIGWGWSFLKGIVKKKKITEQKIPAQQIPPQQIKEID